MKTHYAIFLAAFISFLLQSFINVHSASPNDIIGCYWSPEKDAKIEIYQKGRYYFGKFIWLAHSRKDIKNPVIALQSREVLNMEFLTGFSLNDGQYINGQVYDPKSGRTYSCKMTLEGNKLKVRGYVGISLFGRTEYFEKINL